MNSIKRRLDRLERVHSRPSDNDEIPLAEYMPWVLRRTHERFTACGRPIPDSIRSPFERGFEILQLPDDTRERLRTWLGICGGS